MSGIGYLGLAVAFLSAVITVALFLGGEYLASWILLCVSTLLPFMRLGAA